MFMGVNKRLQNATVANSKLSRDDFFDILIFLLLFYGLQF